MKNQVKQKLSGKSKDAVVTKNQVKQMIDSAVSKEKQVKWTVYEVQTTVSDYSGMLVPVLYPAQGVEAYSSDETGSTAGQRVGNKIEFQELVYNTYWNMDESAETTFVREIIFQWLQPIENSGDVPEAGDILQNGGGSIPYLSPLNYENRTKYHIISDRTLVLTNSGYNQALTYRKNVRSLPVKSLKFIGDDQSGTSAALIKGNLFVYVVSNQDPLVGHPPVYGFSSALYYTD